MLSYLNRHLILVKQKDFMRVIKIIKDCDGDGGLRHANPSAKIESYGVYDNSRPWCVSFMCFDDQWVKVVKKLNKIKSIKIG